MDSYCAVEQSEMLLQTVSEVVVAGLDWNWLALQGVNSKQVVSTVSVAAVA
jgi:hypothetical protein